jgi:hypothetical protein
MWVAVLVWVCPKPDGDKSAAWQTANPIRTATQIHYTELKNMLRARLAELADAPSHKQLPVM